MDRGEDLKYGERDADRGGRGYHSVGRGGYRGGRSPNRQHGYRNARSPQRSPPRRSPPPRRGRTPPRRDDEYLPNTGRFDERARSRSPPRRSKSPGPMRGRRDYGYRGRPQSPRLEERPRSPATYGQPLSPYGGQMRSRSPPPGPYQDFDGREGPTPREEHKRPSRDVGYRSRARSRSPHVSSHPSHGETPNSSRRSSPRSYERGRAEKPSGYNSRYGQGGDRPSPRYPPRDRSPPRRGHSPTTRSPRGYSPPPKSPRNGGSGWQRDRDARPPRRDADYPSGERDYPARPRDPTYVGPTSRTWRKPEGSSSGGPPREDAPPLDTPMEAEPGDVHGQRSPPTGPPHRPDMLSAPTHPRGGRGGPTPGRDQRESHDTRDFRDSRGPNYRDAPYNDRGRGGYRGPPPRGGPPYERSGPGPRSAGNHYGSSHHYHDGQAPSHSPPPRDYGPPPPRDRDPRDRDPRDRDPRDRDPRGPPSAGQAPPFRSNNSTSTTYPQTRFFNNAGPRSKTGPSGGGGGDGRSGSGGTNGHPLDGLEKMVDGGKKLPSALDPAQERRLQQLEEERKKLMEQIEEKQRAKRQSLRDWDTAERESRRDGLKSELAEGQLERLGGEGGGSAAY